MKEEMKAWVASVGKRLKDFAASIMDEPRQRGRAFFVTLHFSREACGKAVAAVEAIVGISCDNGHGEKYVTDVTTVELEERGCSFLAKALVSGRAQREGAHGEAVAVRYKVHFADGEVVETAETILFPYEWHLSDSWHDYCSTMGILARQFATEAFTQYSACKHAVRYPQ